MKRWIYFLLCIVIGSAALIGAWLMPVHLRAVDDGIVQLAGEQTTGLVERGLVLVEEKKLGAAELLGQVADQERIFEHEKLRKAINALDKRHPELRTVGEVPRLKTLQGLTHKKVSPAGRVGTVTNGFVPVTELVIRSENRSQIVKVLETSTRQSVRELLRCRSLTNTTTFSPSRSSSGQAFDTALSICGLLIEGQHLSPGLSNAVSSAVSQSLYGKNSQPLEQIFLDLLSLGQRLNWGQLVEFIAPTEDAETLRLQTNLARRPDTRWPVFFSAVQLSRQPSAVVKYLMTFGQTGEKDLAASLQFGAGGVAELVSRQQRLHISRFDRYVAPEFCWHTPGLALMLKWVFFWFAGFMLAVALQIMLLPAAADRPVKSRGLNFAREILFALGFLLVVLLLSEPFLAQESQNVEFPIRLHLPTVSSAVSIEKQDGHSSIMNQLSILTLLLFFVLQALLYTASLIKLAEIRRQNFVPRIKLKLLDNEDHLFDAGLYLGFAGTIISLILVSMGVIKPSLMAAYSSTSFGVIFVSVFKIFHLRPLRRKLLLEAETEISRTIAPTPANPFVTPL
ncbi:MAG: hypothetical protein ABI042_14050 [Verrucomicrobiota bacterium]